MKPSVIFGLTVVALLLSGCARTTLMSAYKLRNVDPQTTNLHVLRVAVQFPKQFRIQNNGVTLRMRIGKTAFHAEVVEVFHLKPDQASMRDPGLLRYRTANSVLHVFRLATKDIPRFDPLRRRKARDRQGNRQERSLSVSAKLCRTSQRIPDRLPVSTFLKVEETNEFVPLTIDTDLIKEARGRQEIKNLAPLCPTTKG